MWASFFSGVDVSFFELPRYKVVDGELVECQDGHLYKGEDMYRMITNIVDAFSEFDGNKGCGCCSDKGMDEAEDRLAELLGCCRDGEYWDWYAHAGNLMGALE